LEPESKKVDGKGVGKPSDCVEAVRRKPVFKAESIPPDGAVAAEAVAATSIDRLEVHHRQEVTVAGVRLASQRFRANGEASMVLVDMEDRAGIYQVLWSRAGGDPGSRRRRSARVDPGAGTRDSKGVREQR
jgi:hypothetical protein